MAHSRQIVVGIGALLLALSVVGLLTRFELSEALLVWPIVLLLAGTPAAMSFIAPRYANWTFWATALCAVVWALWVVYMSSDGNASAALMIIGVGGFVGFSLAAVAQMIVVVPRWFAQDADAKTQTLAVTLQTLMVVLVVVAATTDFAFTTRFRLSQPAFDSEAGRLMAGAPVRAPIRVGSFTVSDAATDTRTVTLTLGDEFTQVIFSPRGVPGSADEGFSHLTGKWWLEEHND